MPDIGVMSSGDMVALERVCINAIKVDNVLAEGIPTEITLFGGGHLFEQLHGKNPYWQLEEPAAPGLGTQAYEIETVK